MLDKEGTPVRVRVGQGIDLHRFVAGGPLHIGCVAVPHGLHLEGHSDGDAVAHAIADALLSAGGLGDLGTFLPAGDPITLGISGTDILRRAGDALSRVAVRIVNIDCTVICDEPALGGHRAAMEQAVAAALQIPPELVSVKPRHAEGLGFVGRGEGVWASAVVLVEISDAGPQDIR